MKVRLAWGLSFRVKWERKQCGWPWLVCWEFIVGSKIMGLRFGCCCSYLFHKWSALLVYGNLSFITYTLVYYIYIYIFIIYECAFGMKIVISS